MQTWAQVFTRAGSDVSFRDVTIKIPDSGCDQGCEWRHAPEAWAEIWEKSVSWVLASEEEGWLSLVRRGLAVGAHVVWGRWKSQVYLIPYVEKSLNSKVIKSFVLELRSCKCFLCFGIPMLPIYVRCGQYERFAYRYEYVYFTYLYLAMLHFFQAVAASILSYGCITWILTKNIKKKPDVNSTKTLCALINIY